MSMPEQRSDHFQEQRDRFLGFAFAAADVLVEITSKGAIAFASGATRQLLGFDAAELINMNFSKLVQKKDKGFFNILMLGMEPGVRLDPKAIAIVAKNGRQKRVIISGFCLPDRRSQYFLTISDARRMPETSYNEEEYDQSSGMLKKDAFIEAAGRKIKSFDSEEEEQLSFLMIKGLEKLRETKGPEAVDDFLRRLSDRLRAKSIAGDSVGLLGDGKIGIIHDGDGDAELIQEEAARLAKEISTADNEVSVEKFTVDLKVSSMSEEDASRAMIYAIRQFSERTDGEFKVSSLQDGASDLLNDTLGRVSNLRETLLAQSFKVALQPIVDLNTRVIHHYEALTRFEGNKSPAQIISFAEEVDMIEDFDFMMIQRILALLSKHARDGWRPTIAVNVSGKSMESDMFIKQLRKIMAEFGNIRKQLAFELTETAKIRDFERLNKVIQLLRKNGHTVYLDDVGAGNTSFQTIHMLRADAIKIEGQYIQRAISSRRDMAILKSITELAQQFGTQMVGEMIDNEQQVAELRKLRVRFGQGYLFGKPTIDVDKNTFGFDGYANIPTTMKSW